MGPHLHIDCFSGISGDMMLGALVDAGLAPTSLKRGLKALDIQGYRLETTQVQRGPLRATKVNVKIQKGLTAPLSVARIRRLITRSTLPSRVKSQSLEAFDRLARAEGAVHGMAPSKVHFHEIGVIDSLVDVVGGILGCHLLGIQTVSASPVNVGSGTIHSSHGTLPVPGPAVAELARQVPVFSAGPHHELTTPTGMAVLTTLTQEFRLLPCMVTDRIGYGAGSLDSQEWPNVLRIFLGEPYAPGADHLEQIVQIETNVDDLNPQVYETVMDRLFQSGALDVTLTPVIMKRSRPGIVLSALVNPAQVEAVVQAIFQETSTLGIRVQPVTRYTLPRKVERLRLRQGWVRVKTACVGNAAKFIPEFQDCQKIADKTGRPVREILDEVVQELKNIKHKFSSTSTR